MNRFICCIVEFMIAAALVACGGGTEPFASPPVAAIKATAPAPAKKATTVTGGNAVVIHLYQALYGMAPSNALLIDYGFQATNDASLFAKNLTDRFTTTSHADLAKLVLDNLGVTPTSVPAINAKGESEYAILLDAVKQIFAVYPTMRGQVILNMTNLLAGLESDITYGKSATAFSAQANANAAYSLSDASSSSALSSSQEVACTYARPQTITYPPEYSGAFSLPTPIARLPTSVARSMAIIDATPWGDQWSPPAGSSCTDQHAYSLGLWKETLNRLQQDGASRVWIYGGTFFDDLTKPIWTTSTDLNNPATTDFNLKFLVDEAKKRQLEVFYSQQLEFADVKGNSLDPTTLTKENFRKVLDAYHVHIVRRARDAQQLGVAGIQVDWAYPMLTQILPRLPSYDPEFRTMWLNEMSAIIDDIRAVFSGKLIINSIEISLDSKIAAKVDALSITPHFGTFFVTADENKNLTVSLLKGRYKSTIQQIYLDISSQTNSTSINLPVIWHIQVQSKYDYYVTGWTESVYCVISGSNPCLQKTYATDFSVQAIGTEALLEAINEQPYFKSESVNIDAGYWLNDDMVPRTANQPGFPNLHQSIRNKPAENIVKYWFGH